MLKRTLTKRQQQLMNAIVNPSANTSNGLTSWIQQAGSINEEQRLAIYQHSYQARLLACMRAEYPLLIQLFSQPWFDQMASAFLAAHPSTSGNLNDLARGFPDYLLRTRPDDETHDLVSTLIIDVAKLERYRIECARGKGVENIGKRSFTMDAASDLDWLISATHQPLEYLSEHLTEYRSAPNLRLLTSPFNLLDASLQQGDIPPMEHCYIAICRQQYRVQYWSISCWQYQLLQQLQQQPMSVDAVFQWQGYQLTDENLKPIHESIPVFLAQAQNRGCLMPALSSAL